METERQIAAAKEAVHRLQGRISKPHHRLHSNAASDNVNRLRALAWKAYAGSASTWSLSLHAETEKTS